MIPYHLIGIKCVSNNKAARTEIISATEQITYGSVLVH
jgi:hypothetical protein